MVLQKLPQRGGQGLSSKIDEMLKEAKLDVTLMNNLTRSIKNLEASAQALSPAIDAASSSENYSQQMSEASKNWATQQVYAAQISSSGNNAAFNDQVAENAAKLKQQMEALSSNLADLNQVYNGMLKAMNKN